MLSIFLDTRGYFFWLLVVSILCLVLERLRPWRKEQRVLRRGFLQDVFWLFFNGHYFSILLAHAAAFLAVWVAPAVGALKGWNLLHTQPLWLQAAAYFLLKDFLDWGVHNLLHRVPWLWEFHKVHHSIEEMDWIGNFRFHWMEIVVYQSLTYLPLVVLGVEPGVILVVAVLSTLVGHLNHSNLDITWGPLRYVLNSPRMHVWHHAREWPRERPAGVNFGIVLSVWDWLFATVWWPSPEEAPRQQPPRLGFAGLELFPRALLARLLHPLPAAVRRLTRTLKPGAK